MFNIEVKPWEIRKGAIPLLKRKRTTRLHNFTIYNLWKDFLFLGIVRGFGF